MKKFLTIMFSLGAGIGITAITYFYKVTSTESPSGPIMMGCCRYETTKGWPLFYGLIKGNTSMPTTVTSINWINFFADVLIFATIIFVLFFILNKVFSKKSI